MATAMLDDEDLAAKIARLAGALGRFYQALTADTVRAMTPAEARAYSNLYEAMVEFGIAPTVEQHAREHGRGPSDG